MAARPRLRIRDAATGKVVVDYADRLGTIIGVIETGQNNGSVSSPAFALGEAFYALQKVSTGSSNVGPKMTFSGTTLSWAFRNNGWASNANWRIIYGFF